MHEPFTAPFWNPSVFFMRTYYLAFFSAWVHTSYKDNKKAERVVTLKWKEFIVGFFLGGGFVPLENFSLIWRRHHCWWRTAKFDLSSAFMANEQWEFLSVPHLLWHVASVYNGPVTLAPIAERLAGGCHYLFLWLSLPRLGFEHLNLSHARLTL